MGGMHGEGHGMPTAEPSGHPATPPLTAQDVGERFKRAIARWGMTHYAIGRLPDPRRDIALYLTNWPSAWIERYAMNGYAAEDVLMEQARLSPRANTWRELMALYPPGTAARILEAAAEFGWHDGFMVPIHGPGAERGLVSMVGARLCFPSERDRTAAVSLATETYRHAEALFLARGKAPTLAPRERDALGLVARGKDDREIAEALGVTRASAHAYVERAKKRLGATTRAQAVAVAVAHQLIGA